ncbi:MAG: hypothetical protein H0U54_17700 [Acidobacteria bacterium]|nr:hypothetical protein [Acidobacteriota bacterium]
MKRKLPAIIIALAIIILAVGFLLRSFRPSIGEITESWETSNQTFKVKIDRHAEQNGGFVAGAYYVFQSAPSTSNNWREIMTFRHDDPNPIPRDQVRFVNDRVGYVFMGWMYAVTTDGGATWSVWNAQTDLPKWDCCNYRLIGSVNIVPDGTGTMILNPIPQRQGEVPQLHTNDFGQHWNL